jgi:AraC-like DNA-binding protein
MDSRITIILKVIGERSTDVEPALAATCRLLCLSEPRMRRLFKREVGTPLQRYLLQAKMGRAARLSEDRSLSIKQIALASGYRDVSNFYRDFRKVHGQTLGQMRAQQSMNLAA